MHDAEAVAEDAIETDKNNIDVCDPEMSNLAYRLDGNATDPDGGPIASV